MARVHISLYQQHITDLRSQLQFNRNAKYDSVVMPINNLQELNAINFLANEMEVEQDVVPWSRSDLVLTAQEWQQRVVIKLNDDLDLDSADPVVRYQSEAIMKRDLNFAEYLIQTGYVLVNPVRANNTNLARTLMQYDKNIFIVELPITSTKENWERDVDVESDKNEHDSWTKWNAIHTLSNYKTNIRLALELTDEVPGKHEMDRWMGEPVDYIIVPSWLFILNKNNYPVLPKRHQIILAKLSTITTNFMVKAPKSDPKLSLYCEYLEYRVRETSVFSPMQGYEDYLEIPLQPLYDNLNCYTYEVFERDPVKYSLYQKAIEMALVDMVPEEEVETKELVVMIVGAGRGPLVRASLNASTKTKRRIKVYVIEKNPSAVNTLRALKNELWVGKDVTVFSVDMREFTPPQQADILVSELLGSFGDNELSPECLDGAQKYLKPTGISIPCSSTSFINPIMSARLYDKARKIDMKANVIDASIPPSATSLECSYVVYPRNVYYIDKPQTVFHFVHPNKDARINNERHVELEFKAQIDCVLHGFVGYFESVLYKDVKISIHPYEHTMGMASWFPIFFPMTTPIHVKEDAKIVANFWRCVGSRQVWYEWNVTEPTLSKVHNFRGESSPILK